MTLPRFDAPSASWRRSGLLAAYIEHPKDVVSHGALDEVKAHLRDKIKTQEKYWDSVTCCAGWDVWMRVPDIIANPL